MDLTTIKLVGSPISCWETPGASDAVYRVRRSSSLTAVREGGRALGVDLCLWVARDSHTGVGRVAVVWPTDAAPIPSAPLIGRATTIRGCACNHLNPLICKSRNSLSPGIDGAIPLKRGHTTPYYPGKTTIEDCGAGSLLDPCP